MIIIDKKQTWSCREKWCKFYDRRFLMDESTLETLTHISSRRPNQINFRIPSEKILLHMSVVVFIKCRLSWAWYRRKKRESQLILQPLMRTRDRETPKWNWISRQLRDQCVLDLSLTGFLSFKFIKTLPERNCDMKNASTLLRIYTSWDVGRIIVFWKFESSQNVSSLLLISMSLLLLIKIVKLS